ncbi:MAG: pyridoxamine 5'-phosphate oxidase family protein [Alphaproteobacteria bacterium]|nr:pyridoxamine 5'-phosphate oxidase family protein [Alphaproteobacteria bacterium]
MAARGPAAEEIAAARALLRRARDGVLGTVLAGQPFCSLVTPAPAPDLSPLLFLSALSEHTRHLRADPRCSLLVQGPPAGPNPQRRMRLTITGLAAPVPEAEAAALKARWLARHPYAALYAGFADFALWRIAIGAALLVGGFARARRLAARDLAPDATAVAALAAAEAEITAHVNSAHADALDAIAQGLLGRKGAGWRLVAVDVDGADLARANRLIRLDFTAPVADADGVRKALILAARQGRAALAARAGG